MPKSKETKAAPEAAPATNSDLILSFNASIIAYAHTVFAYSAFVSALIVGCFLHYHKIVENSSWGYPDEWFPSVSATIGDRYPERSLFQVLIALTAGPRFLLLFFNFILSYKKGSTLPYVGFISGFVRTFTCGGWVYITSTDDHDWHDIFMISYILLTIPWTIITTITSEKGSKVRKGRFYTGWAFFATIVPLIYWFIQHKVHDRAGAYSIYAYFEWSLILLDVGFDAWSILDFSTIEVRLYGRGVELASVSTAKKASIGDTAKLDDFSTIGFVANLINSCMFWTVLTSLYLCVWYFPLWYMGISGYEVVILGLSICPLLVASIAPLRRALAAYPQILRVIVTLSGVASYKIEDPEYRLLAVAVGSGLGVTAIAVEQWSLRHSAQKHMSFLTTFALGFIITVALKYSHYSNNPFWVVMHKANGGKNEIGVFLGLLGALFTPSLVNSVQKTVAPEPKTGGTFLLAASGLGSFFFAWQLYLSDSAALAIWTWEGFPIRGPTPITAGPFYFAASIAAVVTSLKVKDHSTFTSWWFSALGGASLLLFHHARHWVSFAGAVVYIYYLVALTPVVFKSVIGHNPGLVFSAAFLINVILSLVSIWIVAYAFVPGGPLLRERTDVLLVLSHLTLTAGVINLRNKSGGFSVNKATWKLIKQASFVITVVTAFTATTFIKRYPTAAPKPYNEDSGSFTAGIWCVHFGLDNDMWASETRMANLLREAEVDIIGLLETDTQRLIGGVRDFTQTMAEELDMYVDYGPGPNKHTWGSALLSKFPIIRSQHHLLPSPVGELAPAISATLDIYGEHVDVVVFHSGQEEDPEDRRLQSLYLQNVMGESQNPLVLLSYLVTEPLKGNYNTYVSEKSRVYDIDSTDWDRWCEYILFRELKKVAYARISRSTITDTELQIAKFKLLTEEQKQQNDVDFLYGNHFVDESDVPENLRMPSLFRGDGVRGHRYHVFDEPRYFAL